jgi:hypothetical protein
MLRFVQPIPQPDTNEYEESIPLMPHLSPIYGPLACEYPW